MKLLVLLFSLLTPEPPAPTKYPVSEIPEDLKQGMYAVIREQAQEYEIKAINRSRLKVKLAITILNSKASDYASLVVDYDKDTEVEYLEGSVYDAEGKQIKKLKNSDIIDRSAISGYSLYEDNRMKIADLSQEIYPYTVEFEYQVYRKVLYSIPGFTLYTDDEISSQLSSYSIIYPASLKPRYHLYKIEEPTKTVLADQRIQLDWTFKDIIPEKFEKWSPPINRVVPNVALAPSEFEFSGYKGNMSTWQGIGKWQILLNQGRDELPAETKLKVKQLTAGLKTDWEKIDVLYKYMQSKTRYVSVQLGIGGFQPIDARTVDQVGYGDCKALSNYMIALLKAAGITGYYTWVYGGEGMRAVSPDFPIDYFNHIIVAVPQKRDTVWLECTSQIMDTGFLGDFTSNRYALMVTEGGGKLVKTPTYSAEQNRQITKIDVLISPTGESIADLKRIQTGLQSENRGLSSIIEANQLDEQKKWLEKAFDLPSYNVRSYRFTKSDSIVPVAEITANLEVRKYSTVSGKRLFVTPNMLNKFSVSVEKTDNRKNPIVRRMAFIDIDTVVYSIPEPFNPEYQPNPIKVSSRFGEYEAQFKQDQNRFIYIRRLKMNSGEFPPESYDELIGFLKAISKADNTKVVFVNKT